MRLGGKKVYTLAYADDIAVMAEDEEGMKGMMESWKGIWMGRG